MHAAFNPCGTTNGGCSHFCLLSAVDPRGFSCHCPEGMTLGDDLASCTFKNGTTIAPSLSPLGNIIIRSSKASIGYIKLDHCMVSGSCLASGYSSCCVNSSSCWISSSNCFCDANCHLFKDCCSDVPPDCKDQGIPL